MSVEFDTSSAKFAEYAHPERLVTDRMARRAPRRARPRRRRVRRGRAALRDRPHPRRGQDRLAHRPQRPGRARLRRRRGLRRAARPQGHLARHTVVIYGDKNNWWAAYALWVFTLFGHEDVRLLDGGRDKWIAEGRADHDRRRPPVTPSSTRSSSATTAPSAPSRTTCSPTSATRSSTSAPPRSTAASARPRPPTPRRARCAPATSRPRQTCRGRAPPPRTARFKSRAELDAIYRDEVGLTDGDDVIAYCRIGERSSHTWFVLHPPARLREGAQLRRVVDRVGQRGARARSSTGAERGESPPIARLSRTRGRMERDDCARPCPTASPRSATTSSAARAARSPAAAARVLERAARAAGAVRRSPRPARAGRRVPVAGVHLRRGRRRRRRAPVRDRAEGGADDARLRVDPRAGPRRAHRPTRCSPIPDDYPQTLGLDARRSRRCASAA